VTGKKFAEVKNPSSPIILNVAVYNATREKSYINHWNESVTGRMIFALNGYTFSLDGKKYMFKTHLLEFSDVVGNGLNNKALFVAPGGSIYWIDQFNHLSEAPIFRERLKNFVAKGGGYIGTCGGSCIATLGKKEPPEREGKSNPDKGAPSWLRSDFYLKMVKIWSNGFWLEEQQYDRKPYRTYRGGIPLNSYILDNNDAKEILGMRGGIVNIRYWGGSAYWGTEEDILPLAKYVQEPMKVYPIHWFWGNKVHTDIMSNDGYSIISATYGEGRLVLFSQHPELRSFYHGSANDIVENFCKTKYRFNKELDPATESNLEFIRNAAKWVSQKALDSNLPLEFVR